MRQAQEERRRRPTGPRHRRTGNRGRRRRRLEPENEAINEEEKQEVRENHKLLQVYFSIFRLELDRTYQEEMRDVTRRSTGAATEGGPADPSITN